MRMIFGVVWSFGVFCLFGWFFGWFFGGSFFLSPLLPTWTLWIFFFVVFLKVQLSQSLGSFLSEEFGLFDAGAAA